MDKTETYIKMSEKAEEIQELRKEEATIDDVCICSACKTRWGNCYEHTEYLSCNSELGGRPFPVVAIKDVEHKSIWLPRQDQLQEMHRGHLPDGMFNNLMDDCYGNWHIDKLREFYRQCIHEQKWIVPSWEQLWLAFVMKEKYNKVWNGDEWI